MSKRKNDWKHNMDANQWLMAAIVIFMLIFIFENPWMWWLIFFLPMFAKGGCGWGWHHEAEPARAKRKNDDTEDYV